MPEPGWPFQEPVRNEGKPLPRPEGSRLGRWLRYTVWCYLTWWPRNPRLLKRMGYRRTGFMTWESPGGPGDG